MIITNNTKRRIYVGGVQLLPGSNVVKDGTFDLSAYPIFEEMVEIGDIEIDEKVTADVAKKAIRKANTQKIVDEISSAAGSAKGVSEAADKRKSELDKIDAEVAEALKKAKEKESK